MKLTNSQYANLALGFKLKAGQLEAYSSQKCLSLQGATMQDFHQLNVWRKAHALVLRVYTASKELPSSETMGLAAHLRRSAVTIPRSIAEGTGRSSDFEFAGDLRKSQAAAHELEYILLLCRDLGFISEPKHDELLEDVLEVRRMISGLVNRLTKAEQPLP